MGKTHYPLSNHMQVNNENAAVETNTNSSCKFYSIYFTLIQFNSFIYCENWSATVNCYPARGQYPTRVSTGSGPILFSHQMTKSLLCQLHWLPVQHQITYKLAVLAYKVQTKSMPAYLSCHIKLRDTVWTLRSPTTN